MSYGKSVSQSMAEHLRLVDAAWQQAILFGTGIVSCGANGKIVGHDYTEIWIDEAPSVGTIGQVPQPRLSFVSKCIRQCFSIESDLTIKTNSLYLL